VYQVDREFFERIEGQKLIYFSIFIQKATKIRTELKLHQSLGKRNLKQKENRIEGTSSINQSF